MGRGGATSSRGRGKFKVSRGGGRHFSRDLDPRNAMQEEESEEESSEEEESSDEDVVEAKLAPAMATVNLKLGNTEDLNAPEEQEMSRAERKAMKKAEAAGKSGKAAKKVQIIEEPESSEEEPVKPVKKAEPSRREREEADKKAAAERYQKMHAQGKTSEAKADLARLAAVRERREAAAAQRKAEQAGKSAY